MRHKGIKDVVSGLFSRGIAEVLKHFRDDLVKILQEELFQGKVVLRIFWFGDERSNIFLLIAMVQMLGRPVDQKYSLEEGIS